MIVDDKPEDFPKPAEPAEVAISLTVRQAAMLTRLDSERQQADQAFVLYASAVIAGSPYEGGTLVGIRPAVNGTPATLVLRA